MENIYPEGSVVYAKENPAQKLVIRRYTKFIYYCTTPGLPTKKDLVFYERELTNRAATANL